MAEPIPLAGMVMILFILLPMPYAVIAVAPYTLTFLVIRRNPNCIVLPPIAVGRPIFKIDITLLLSNLKPLKLIRTSWFFPVRATTPITALGILAISVANAAPPIPHLSTTKKSGSSMRLIETPSILSSNGLTVSPCACFTAEYRLIIKRNGKSITTILIYVSP